jgi:hypothetical protein
MACYETKHTSSMPFSTSTPINYCDLGVILCLRWRTSEQPSSLGCYILSTSELLKFTKVNKLHSKMQPIVDSLREC